MPIAFILESELSNQTISDFLVVVLVLFKVIARLISPPMFNNPERFVVPIPTPCEI